MEISHRDLIKFGIGDEKNRTLSVADRYIFRPIAFLVLPLAFHYFRLTPNKISILSFFFAAAGFCLFFLSTNIVTIYFGCLLCIIFMIMDCMDGTLARVLKTKYQIENPLGEFFDAFVGYFFVVGLWTSLGYYLTQINDDISWYILGTFSSFAAIYARVAFLKLSLVKLEQGIVENDMKQNRETKLYKLRQNLDWGGFLLFLIPLAILFRVLELLLIIQLILNFGMCGWMLRYVYLQSAKYPMHKQVSD